MADTDTRKEQRAAARAERARAEAERARMRRRLWQLGGVLAIAVVVVVGIVIAAGGGGNSKPKLKAGESIPGQSETNALFAGIQQSGITVGDPKAPITVVEFADLQCPFCQAYTTEVLAPIVAGYVRTGKVKMVFRNVAFIGTDSVRAAQMAAAAGLQNKLWQYIDLFYTNQGEENSGYVTDDFLRKVGHGVKGLDVEKAMNDRGIATVQKQLNDAQSEWTSNGFTGTPSFLIGPTGGTLKPMGANDHLSVKSMSAAIDKALQQQQGKQ
ncbi:MAG TPA: thioredoxin domain-containing protein [Conexibacter sp.]|nr:thioredoxin domain-containing protein [Conexibacter sp.]